MGTRADFYIGKGKEAEWLGSIAWDGSDIPASIDKAKTPKAYRTAVTKFLQSRDDATWPKDGWPWPWNDSGTTDCSYWFFGGRTWEAIGYPTEYYVRRNERQPDADEDEPAYREWLQKHERVEFPDMSARKNVAMGKRSGLIVFQQQA